MHIYDFITDQTQYRLKKGFDQAPFERRMADYSTAFIKTLDALDNSDEPRFLNKDLYDNADAKQWLDDLLAIVRADTANLRRLADDILEIYTTFLAGQHHVAVTLFAHLLTKYDLLDKVSPADLGGFFRGRPMSKGDAIHQETFFYHIPFSMRFLIGNQRFSFSGLPLLYAGQSMMAVFYELNAASLNDEHLATCLLAYDPIADLGLGRWLEPLNSRENIYDISNQIFEIVNTEFYQYIEQGVPIPRIGNSSLYSKPAIRRAFRKFLLSHYCTFYKATKDIFSVKERKWVSINNPHFVEEYVLPQLLMEAVRQHKYDGIIYPSTKFAGRNIKINSNWKSNIFQNNIAIFSVYRPDRGMYDEELFQSYKIHTVNFNRINDEDVVKGGKIKSFDAVDGAVRLKTNIDHYTKFMKKNIPVNDYNQKLFVAFFHIEKKISLYRNMTVDDQPYLETFAGKMELYYLICYFKFVRRQVHQLNRDLIDRLPPDGQGTNGK